MYKPLFNQRKAIRFRQFSRKGYALFACLGRVVTIGVLSAATLKSASAATDDFSTKTETADHDDDSTVKEATLDDVEVTGSRAPLSLRQTTRMVTVLSREEIQAAPAQSVNDLLKMAVGIDVRQRGPMGIQTDISIRGGTQEQISILLNGINICDPQTGHNTFDLPCDVSDIVRIEVLEGPAARVYGSSSLLGAINVVTRHQANDSEKRRGEARLEAGSFGYASAAAHLSHSFLSSSLSASYTRSDGYSRSKNGALNSDYNGEKAFYQGSYQKGAAQLNWHVGLSAKGFGSNTFYSARFDEQYEHTNKTFTALQGTLTLGSLHLKPSAYWNLSCDRFELIRGDESKVPFNSHCTNVLGFNMNSWMEWAAGRTAFGAELRNEDIVSSNLGEPLNSSHSSKYKYGLNRTNLSLHLEHNIILNHFTMSAGFIAFKNSWNKMPMKVYPSMDASLRIGSHWKVYASYNTSLRLPSFTELYYSVGGHQADKFLKPEELQAMEGGIKYNSSLLTAQAAVFHHHALNLIDWVMDTRDTQPVWQSVNHTRLNTLGEEVSVIMALPPLFPHTKAASFKLAYCHLHQHKQAEPFIQSQYALEYLRHKLTAELRMPIARNISLTAGCRWQDRMGTYTSTSGEVHHYHPYWVFDARLSWDTKAFSLYVYGNNLTAHRYVDYGNVPQPGCTVTCGTRIHI
jgi:iron complex outermembrane receptor protein